MWSWLWIRIESAEYPVFYLTHNTTLLRCADLLNTVYLHKYTDENSNSSFSVTCNYTEILLDMLVVYCTACLKATTNGGLGKALQQTS